ncbi:sulfurtransferase [Pontibacter anaerobius]|uniref:Sulfurtransferase n=1 Tax=Pontibacter anaerobius TaxID=2993940 RepID=A0ABT3RK83_9BACT|nr:sulfurtransferase [Pontibacter anaerobius]MCX2742017.1 sulfurtransferase [Pontibacter anaerobius]
MEPIIKPQELVSLLQKEALILIDARSGPTARDKYKTEHLQGAQFVDLESDLATPPANAAEGGRHPLPDVTAFAGLLGRLGIKPNSHVVVYDDMSGANAAARFWWMLRALGHEQVQVLDGGYEAAKEAGVPTSSQTEQPTPQPPYPQQGWQLPTTTVEEVEKAAQNPDNLVIDVRAAARFRGETEPIDLVAGHIPGAVNVPFTSNLDSKGFYLPQQELRTKYTEALGNRKAEDVMVHCGSGVTACHTLLAMDYAGMEMPKLYVGSWSEWSRSGRKVATGEK